MQILAHSPATAEVIEETVLIEDLDQALQLLGDLYYQGFDKLVLREHHFSPEFFDLKTRLAGDILQKFTQYRMALVIVGDFSRYTSKSLQDFIYESNRGNQVRFVATLEEAL